MRARIALAESGQDVEVREVVLRDKPPEMLALSPKGTVPVLQLTDGTVLEESQDIIDWALALRDPNDWLESNRRCPTELRALLEMNDGDFKFHLDRYKYANRYEDVQADEHRLAAERFLQRLEDRLSDHPFLFGTSRSVADISIAPFIRQFANTDRSWFDTSPYPQVLAWLEGFLNWKGFTQIMAKHKRWNPDAAPVLFLESLL